MHSAERDLLRTAQRSELTHAIATLAQQSALATAAKAQAISALTASKIAALDPQLSIEVRVAAIARLKDEEAAELVSMLLDEASRAKQLRQASIGVIKSAQKVRAADQGRRQRAERLSMTVSGRKRKRRRINNGAPHAAVNPSLLRFRPSR
ncbi:MAG: hypothetical protein ABL904_21290 [Hyphomicrobiaceae bacterium]